MTPESSLYQFNIHLSPGDYVVRQILPYHIQPMMSDKFVTNIHKFVCSAIEHGQESPTANETMKINISTEDFKEKPLKASMPLK